MGGSGSGLDDARFGEIAIARGLVTPEQLEKARAILREESRSGKRATLGQVLVRTRVIPAKALIEIVREAENRPFKCPSCLARLSREEAEDPHGPTCRICGARLELPPETKHDSVPDTLEKSIVDSTFSGSYADLVVPLEKARPPLPPVLRYGKFEIIEVLGQGGMGVVYKARATDAGGTAQPGTVVALKVLRAGANASQHQIARFGREAETIAKLRHPDVVGLVDQDLAAREPWIAMEFVAGKTLQDRIVQGPHFTEPEALGLIARIARAVHHANELGIVHRDLKPGNVILSADGPKVTDFGLAKVLTEGSPDLTKPGVAVGTPLYMSPEQAMGKPELVDARADVFALGVLLYQLLSGALPFLGDSHFEIYEKIVYQEPVPLRALAPNVSEGAEQIVHRALAKRREERYQTAAELARDCDAVAAGKAPPEALRVAETRITPAPSGIGGSSVVAREQRQSKLLLASLLTFVAAAATTGTLHLLRTRARTAEIARGADELARARAQASARDLDGAAHAAIEAARAFEESGDPRASEARAGEGYALHRLGRFDEAARAWATAASEARDEEAAALALAGLGRARLGEGRAREARAALEAALAARPSLAFETRDDLARALVRTGDVAAGIALLGNDRDGGARAREAKLLARLVPGATLADIGAPLAAGPIEGFARGALVGVAPTGSELVAVAPGGARRTIVPGGRGPIGALAFSMTDEDEAPFLVAQQSDELRILRLGAAGPSLRLALEVGSLRHAGLVPFAAERPRLAVLRVEAPGARTLEARRGEPRLIDPEVFRELAKRDEAPVAACDAGASGGLLVASAGEKTASLSLLLPGRERDLILAAQTLAPPARAVATIAGGSPATIALLARDGSLHLYALEDSRLVPRRRVPPPAGIGEVTPRLLATADLEDDGRASVLWVLDRRAPGGEGAVELVVLPGRELATGAPLVVGLDPREAPLALLARDRRVFVGYGDRVLVLGGTW